MCRPPVILPSIKDPSMKVPPKRKGNFPEMGTERAGGLLPSMKVPPKRKGNSEFVLDAPVGDQPLNESPSEKEGK